MMKKLKCGVIGAGYLGKFHAQKYAHLAHCELTAICDSKPKVAANLAESLQTTAYQHYRQLLGKVHAVSIVTPSAQHYEIAKFFLENQVHVLVEKPMTSTLAQAETLIKLAKSQDCVLQVGHLERFNPVVQALGPHLDQPLFIEATRLAPFKQRGSDVSVVLDLMIHDLDLIHAMVASPISTIQANGCQLLSNHVDMASARLTFANGCVANITASRVSEQPTRQLRVFQRHNYLALDLQNGNFCQYYQGENTKNGVATLSQKAQNFNNADALLAEINAFTQAILQKESVVVSGEDGKNALATALRINEIIAGQMASQLAARA